MLEEIVSKKSDPLSLLGDKCTNFYYASLAFITVRTLDIATTIYYCNKHGISKETNPVTTYFMSEFGITPGVLIKNISLTALLMGGAFITNKLSKKYKSIPNNLGNLFLYGLGAGNVLAVINNSYICLMN